MSSPPSYGRTIWLLGTSDKKFAVSRRGSRDLARSLAALVGYLPTNSTPPGAMGNSKAGGVEESNLGDRTTLLNPFDTGQRTHCGGWECSQLTSIGVISTQVSSLSLGFCLDNSEMHLICCASCSGLVTHRDAFAVDALHHSEGRPQVRVPRVLQAVAAVAEAAL